MEDQLPKLIQAYTESPLLFWVLGSVLAYALANSVLWLTRQRDRARRPYSNWPVELARFLFYLGIPYLALGGWPLPPFGGLLTPEDMGLVGLSTRWPPTRWVTATGTALGIGLVAFLVLVLAWTNANRRSDGTKLRFAARPWWTILIDVLYLEIHWAFYRGAMSVELADVYTGAFVGLGLIYVEWALNPFWWRGWRSKHEAALQWLRAALVLVIALIFLLTRNLWLCLGVHLAFELAFWGFGREQTVTETQDSVHNPGPAAEGS